MVIFNLRKAERRTFNAQLPTFNFQPTARQGRRALPLHFHPLAGFSGFLDGLEHALVLQAILEDGLDRLLNDERKIMNAEFMKVRPHPGPLPQEREVISRARGARGRSMPSKEKTEQGTEEGGSNQ